MKKHEILYKVYDYHLLSLKKQNSSSCILGNCYIDFLSFCHRFCIKRQQFLKFERDRNAAKKIKLEIIQKQKNYEIQSKWIKMPVNVIYYH